LLTEITFKKLKLPNKAAILITGINRSKFGKEDQDSVNKL